MKNGHLYKDGGFINWYNCFGGQFGSLYKIKVEHTLWPNKSSQILALAPKGVH